MTKYICHGCEKIYDDEIGYAPKCCGKYIRHRLEDEPRELNTEKAEKTCTTKHVIPPKSKDSGILPNFT